MVMSEYEFFGVQKLPVKKDKPEEGRTYCLLGGSGTPSIANGNSWAESEVLPKESQNLPIDEPER